MSISEKMERMTVGIKTKSSARPRISPPLACATEGKSPKQSSNKMKISFLFIETSNDVRWQEKNVSDVFLCNNTIHMCVYGTFIFCEIDVKLGSIGWFWIAVLFF